MEEGLGGISKVSFRGKSRNMGELKNEIIKSQISLVNMVVSREDDKQSMQGSGQFLTLALTLGRNYDGPVNENVEICVEFL